MTPVWWATVLIASLAWGCEAAEAPRAELTLSLAGERWLLEVPEGAALVPAPEGASRVELHPGGRVPMPIVLAPSEGVEGPLPERAPIGEVGRIRYRTSRASGGSGGTEATLEGELELGSERFRVTCHTQGEPPGPGTWCLDILRTLRRAP